MTSTAGHIRKRQCQPPITNFFNDGRQRGVSALSPPLPEETQASLLTVGMRVRKSVPEGYKTHKTVGAAAFPSVSSAPQPSRSVPQAATARELMPFCGLFKIGGLAAQETTPFSAPAAAQFGAVNQASSGEMALPGLSMSQSTLPSTQESFNSPSSFCDLTIRKRTYEDEAEAEIEAYFDEIQAEERLVPQQPQPIRRIAKMKSSSKAQKPSHVMRAVGDEDFEEAVFLAPMDMDYEDGQ